MPNYQTTPITNIMSVEPIVDWFLSNKINETTLAVAIPPSTLVSTITVDDATGAIPGYYVEIHEAPFYNQIEILAVNGNDITLIYPLGFPYTTDALVRIVNVNLAVNGSVTPVEFSFSPPDNNFGITRFIVTMFHDTAGDDGKFGDLAPLLNGVYTGLREKVLTGTPSEFTVFYNTYNFKTNGDFANVSYDVTYNAKTGNPQSPGAFSTRVRKSYGGQDKSNGWIELLSNDDASLYFIVRDDLSALERFTVNFSGRSMNGDER